jgi:transcription antitermination factor NusA-like protein
MRTILNELGLESPLVGTTVTAHIKSVGPDGFHCAVYDVGTGQAHEALLPRVDAFDLPEGVEPPELSPGDTLIALVVGVSAGARSGTERLILSATTPDLVGRILSGFVEEIIKGKVVIKGIARVAGTKAKIAVAPTSGDVDARGACIGRNASRIRGAELLLNRAFGRERLEIIQYSGNRATFLVNAMSPVEVSDVLVERDNAIVAVEEHQLSGGIGQGGLNAQLAGRLTGLFVRVVKTGTDLRAAMAALRAEKAEAERPAPSEGAPSEAVAGLV